MGQDEENEIFSSFLHNKSLIHMNLTSTKKSTPYFCVLSHWRTPLKNQVRSFGSFFEKRDAFYSWTLWTQQSGTCSPFSYVYLHNIFLRFRTAIKYTTNHSPKIMNKLYLSELMQNISIHYLQVFIVTHCSSSLYQESQLLDS